MFLVETPFLLVMRGNQIIDVSLKPGDKTTGNIVPIVSVEGGTQVDYDTETKSLYWVEGLKVDEEDETVNSVNVCLIEENILNKCSSNNFMFVQCTLMMSPYHGGNKSSLLGELNGFVGAPYVIAFDWNGRNLYIGNRESSSLEVVKVDGVNKYRMVLLSNNGKDVSVATPVGIVLDPNEGYVTVNRIFF